MKPNQLVLFISLSIVASFLSYIIISNTKTRLLNSLINKTPQETTGTPQTGILSTQFIANSCDIEVKTTEKFIKLTTQYTKLGAFPLCTNFIKFTLSPDHKYLAYEDTFEGAQAILKLYSQSQNNWLWIDSFGGAEILDLFFLPDNNLAVLEGYKNNYNEQYLSLYKTTAIFDNLPSLNQEHNYVAKTNDYKTTVKLPNNGSAYNKIAYQNGKVIIYTLNSLDKPAYTYPTQ